MRRSGLEDRDAVIGELANAVCCQGAGMGTSRDFENQVVVLHGVRGSVVRRKLYRQPAQLVQRLVKGAGETHVTAPAVVQVGGVHQWKLRKHADDVWVVCLERAVQLRDVQVDHLSGPRIVVNRLSQLDADDVLEWDRQVDDVPGRVGVQPCVPGTAVDGIQEHAHRHSAFYVMHSWSWMLCDCVCVYDALRILCL